MRIICVGHAALDRVFAVDRWPTGSAKIVASSFEEAGGGMAANAAVAIARLGAEVAFWGPTGDDATADVIETQLRSERVDVRNLQRLPGMRSSSSAVLIDAQGERLVVGFRSEALHSPAQWLPLGAIAQADAVLADVRWPNGAAAALQAALAAGDVFHGAYALAIALERPVAEAMRFASAAAAIKCMRPGGRGGAPTLAEVEAFLQQNGWL